MDVGLLLVAMLKNTVWEQFDYDEGVAETVGVQWDYVSGVEDLREIRKRL